MTLVALALSTLCGLSLWQLVLGRPRGIFGWSAALGAGYLSGAVLLGVVLSRFDGAATATLFSRLAPWLAGFALVVGFVGWRFSPARELSPPVAAPTSRRERWFIVFVLALLLVTLVVLLQQASSLPSLSWDAWNAWLAKSKAWTHGGHFVPARGFEEWSVATPGTLISTEGWIYPEALPRYAVWLASAAGGWHEGAVHLAWPFAWVALGLACFGYLGLLGLRATAALVATAALLMLPLVTAHAALAGYADTWLGAMLMLAALHAVRWFRERNWRDAVAAILFAALLPAIKAEGAIWMLCLLGAGVLCLLPARWRWGLVIGAVALWAAAIPFGGLPVPLPGLGIARLDWGAITIPTRGVMTLSWRPVLDEVAQALFLLPNFALLWYVAPLIVALRWRELPRHAVLGWFLAFGYGFLFLLFFFTDAAAWAESLTSVNRVLMQIVPATVVWLSLLWTGSGPRDTAPSSAH